MTIQRVLRTLGVVGGAAVLVAGLAAPASAAPIDRGTFHDVVHELSTDDPDWPCTDLGFVVTIDVDVHGSYLLTTHGPGTLPTGRQSSQGTVSYSANGHTYTQVLAVGDRDVEVVDNGDGTLTITSQGAGMVAWYLDGERVFFDPGMIRYQILVDDGGTPSDPGDDEFLAYLGDLRESTGVNDTPTRGFCEDIAEFLAP